MIGHQLSSNNEMGYSAKTQTFSPTKHTRKKRMDTIANATRECKNIGKPAVRLNRKRLIDLHMFQKENSDKLSFSAFSRNNTNGRCIKTFYIYIWRQPTPTLLDEINTLAQQCQVACGWGCSISCTHQSSSQILSAKYFNTMALTIVFCFKFLCVAIPSKIMEVGGSKDKKHMLGKKHVLTCFHLI